MSPQFYGKLFSISGFVPKKWHPELLHVLQCTLNKNSQSSAHRSSQPMRHIRMNSSDGLIIFDALSNDTICTSLRRLPEALDLGTFCIFQKLFQSTLAIDRHTNGTFRWSIVIKLGSHEKHKMLLHITKFHRSAPPNGGKIAEKPPFRAWIFRSTRAFLFLNIERYIWYCWKEHWILFRKCAIRFALSFIFAKWQPPQFEMTLLRKNHFRTDLVMWRLTMTSPSVVMWYSSTSTTTFVFRVMTHLEYPGCQKPSNEFFAWKQHFRLGSRETP